MKAYKLVKFYPDSNLMTSIVPSAYECTYKLGQTTFPKKGHLFVLRTREEARHLKGRMFDTLGKFVILQGEVENLAPNSPQVVCMNTMEDFREEQTLMVRWFWSRASDYFVKYPMGIPERGTMFAWDFTPIKRVR